MPGELIDILSRLQSCRRLIDVAPAPVRLPAGTDGDRAPQAEAGAELGLGAMLRMACGGLGIRPFAETPAEVASACALERVVWRRLGLTQDALTPWAGHPIERAEAEAAIRAVQANDPARAFDVHSIRSPRGAKLSVYAAGPSDRSTWLLVLPYGVPADLSFQLARDVTRRHRFITFEGPDLHDDLDSFDAYAHGVDQTAADILAVMDFFGLSRAHLAGVCAGAVPALQFARLHANRVASLVLGNGSYNAKPFPPSDIIFERVGGQRKKAQAFYNFISTQGMSGVEPEFAHLTVLPYSNPDLLYMYATSYRAFYDRDLGRDVDEWARGIDRPACVMLGECDKQVPPELSRDIARKLKRSRMLSDADGTHLSLLAKPKPRMVEAMLAFCAEHE